MLRLQVSVFFFRAKILKCFPHEITLDDDTYHKNVNMADLDVDVATLGCQAEKTFSELEKQYTRVIGWDPSLQNISLVNYLDFKVT